MTIRHTVSNAATVLIRQLFTRKLVQAVYYFGLNTDLGQNVKSLFQKPVDMCISFIERPFPLISSGGRFKYSEHTIEHLLKWPLVIYSRPVPYLALFVRELGDDEYKLALE